MIKNYLACFAQSDLRSELLDLFESPPAPQVVHDVEERVFSLFVPIYESVGKEQEEDRKYNTK